MSKRELAVGIVLTFLFFGGWMVGAAEGPYLPVRGLIAALMFGGFAWLGNFAEQRGWFDEDHRDPAPNQEVKTCAVAKNPRLARVKWARIRQRAR